MSTSKDTHQQIAPGTVELGEDFSQHRITGYVAHTGQWLDVPLVSHVTGSFYQGGCMGGVKLPDEFDFVLSLYPWEQYELGPDTERVEVRMYDSLNQALDQVTSLANQVIDQLEAGRNVLVHCQAGLNRSGLLAARVLTLRGYTGDEAVEKLRAQRSPMVLCNPTFESYIRSIK